MYRCLLNAIITGYNRSSKRAAISKPRNVAPLAKGELQDL